MEILGRIRVEADAPAVDQAAASPERIAAVEVIVLQEHQDVVLVDLDDADVHRLKIDGLEREDELLRIGKDASGKRNFHRRFLFCRSE